MPDARIAFANDLVSLLALFDASDVSRYAEPEERAEHIWAEILARDGLFVFVSDADNRIVSTCMLVTVPKLLRGGRQHGSIENVVTHPDYQGLGHGRAVVGAALDDVGDKIAITFLSKTGGPTRVFTVSTMAGFQPGLRTAYAATRPAKFTDSR